MPKIILHDGKEKTVKYDVACTIFQILQGDAETIDKATKQQLLFAKQVKDVKFDPIRKHGVVKVKNKGGISKEIKEVMARTDLTGSQKFDLLAKRLRAGV